MKRKLKDKIQDAKNLLELRGSKGIFDTNEYMCGLFNGMEIILSIFEEREPKYKNQKGE